MGRLGAILNALGAFLGYLRRKSDAEARVAENREAIREQADDIREERREARLDAEDDARRGDARDRLRRGE